MGYERKSFSNSLDCQLLKRGIVSCRDLLKRRAKEKQRLLEKYNTLAANRTVYKNFSLLTAVVDDLEVL
jgi:hypothetical protein